MKNSRVVFVNGVPRIPSHFCIQCKHFFNDNELLADYLINSDSLFITCPECGVENVR